MRDFVEECFKDVAASNKYAIDIMEIAEDHVHISLGFAPRHF